MVGQRMFGFKFLAIFLVLFSLISVNSGGKIIHNEPTLSLSKGPPNSQLRIPSFVDSTDGSQTGNVWPFARNRREILRSVPYECCVRDYCFQCHYYLSEGETEASALLLTANRRHNKKKTKTTDVQTPRAPRIGTVPEGHTRHAPPKTKDITGFPNLEHVPPKSDKKRWRNPATNELYEWDSEKGELEKYNKRGKHLGSFDPSTGEQRGPAKPERTIEV